MTRTGVYNAARAVHVVKSQEDLFRDLADDMHRNALVLVAPDEAQQVLAQDLEDHANMRAIRPFVAEVVEEANDVLPAGM